MKKARVVEIPKDRPLTVDEYEDLSKHAFNSSLWQLTTYRRSAQELRDKLLQKGYPQGVVLVAMDAEGTVESKDLIEDTIARLIYLEYLDDLRTAQAIAEQEIRRKKGIVMVRQKLMQKRFDRATIEKAIEQASHHESFDDALAAAAQRYMQRSVYRRLESDYERKMKLMQHLMSRGFSAGDVREYVEGILE